MLIFGKNPVLYTLNKHPSLIEEVLLSKELDNKLFKEFAKLDKKIIRVDNKKAQALSKGKNHQGMFLNIKDIPLLEIDEVLKFDKILILVGVSDVGNIGAIVRSAYCFGIDTIVISGIGSFNLEGVVRSSSGAALDLPMAFYKDTADLLNRLKQNSFDISALDGKGEPLVINKQSKKIAMLLGAEDEGIPNKILKKCDHVYKIGLKREFDSLNVSVAAAIFMDRMYNG